MTEVNVNEILGRYEMRSAPPILDSLEKESVLQHFSNLGYSVILGVVAPAGTTVGQMFRASLYASETAKQPGAVIGPHFAGDEYYSTGFAIWNKR